MNKGKKGISYKAGLTLIEIIVVVSLIGIISGIVLANYRDFQKRVVLENLAQDVALSLRLAQTYGLNVRTGGGGVFEGSYGIHFADAEQAQYILFRDSDRILGGGYGYAFGGIDVTTYSLGDGYLISDVCATGASTDCFSTNDITTLDILFDRPKPDSIFTSDTGAAYGSATITITGPSGLSRTVDILSTGYISIQ